MKAERYGHKMQYNDFFSGFISLPSYGTKLCPGATSDLNL